MSIVNDLAFSMLSYSKIYEPYVFAWGKRTGREMIKERLELNVKPTLKSNNIFELGLTAGTLDKLISDKIITEKIKYSQTHYKMMREKNIKDLNGGNILKAAYPQILLSPGSHTLMYWIGRETGMKLGDKHSHSVKEFQKITNKLDIGEVEIRGNKVILHDSMFAKEADGKRVCSYYAGLLAGFLSSEKRCNVIETKCIANGDDHCEFVTLFV